MRPSDWTGGAHHLLVTTCSRCGNHWYLPRDHCPVCGSAQTASAPAAGTGLCVAVTRLHVTRDGTGPVALGLVELDEGPIVMGQVHDEALAPGDRARVEFVGSPIVPSFTREGTR